MTGGPTAEQLAELEAEVGHALDSRDPSALHVLGFGELSLALGWPADAPSYVCKRTPPFTGAQFDQYEQLVTRYIDRVRDHGLAVVDSTVAAVDGAGSDPSRSLRSGSESQSVVGYLVQPLLAQESLGHNVLAGAEPDSEHPFLAAVGSALDLVSTQLSIDAQVTNFSWDPAAGVLTLIDVGTPFVWDPAGELLFDMDPFLAALPAAVRPFAKRDLTKVTNRWRSKRDVALDIVANLWREGLDDWVTPALAAFGNAIEPDLSLHPDEARALYEDDLKTWPRLKKLQRVERAWQTKVRRRRYEFFIHSTFEGGHTY